MGAAGSNSDPETHARTIAAYRRAYMRLTAPDGPFKLLDVQIDSRSQRTFAAAKKSVSDILSDAERAYAHNILVVEGNLSLTYGAAFGAARRLASSMVSRYGLRAGDRVGIVMRNRPEWFIAYCAVMTLGCVAVLFNSRSTAPELAAAVTQVPCALFIADNEREEHVNVTEAPVLDLADLAALSEYGRPELAPARADPESTASILFTSGTTGGARAAELTQRNLTNMECNVAFIAAMTTEIEAELLGVPPEQLRGSAPRAVGLLVFPMFHISGLTAFFRTIACGGQIVLLRRWDPDAALAAISEHRINMISGPPLVLSDLLDAVRSTEQLSTLNALVVGGQSIVPSLVERAETLVPHAGMSIGWGMTEASGAVAAAAGSLYRAQPQSSGIALPLTDIRAVDDDCRPLPIGEVGELELRGALVMKGYFGAPEATANAFRDGWLRTGDIGMVDADGFVHLVDRKKDIVICGGENVYCGEVERVLGAHRDVIEALVFGIPDARLGERVVAAVRLREGAVTTEEDMRAAVRPTLASYKIPSNIAFDLPEFPRNATGKVNKAVLRTIFLARMQQSESA